MADDIAAVTIETPTGSATLSPDELHALARGGDEEESDAMRGARRLVEELVDVAGGPPSAPRRQVEFKMTAEDFRAMIGRCLLFASTRDEWAGVRVEVAPYWAKASALDGYTLAVQKMRCQAEAEGVFALSTYDAQRMLKMLPRPRKDEQLGDVVIDFVTGEGQSPVNLRYEGDDDRLVVYGCHGLDVASFPDFRKLLAYDRTAPASEPRFAVSPQFLAQVAKAELLAKDQIPFAVRWYLRPAKSAGENPLVVAYFAVNEGHDEFAAVLTPVGVQWDGKDSLAAIVDRLGAPGAESDRLRPQQHSLEVD
ncbi:MAG: hypothetical protein AB7I38_11150 [Dehalococcoidia bacterium]